MKKPNLKKDTIMTDVNEKKARGSRKGSVRKPQEFLVIAGLTDKSTGAAVDLANYDISLTISKDYKSALSIVKGDPTRAVVEVVMPKFKVAATEAAE